MCSTRAVSMVAYGVPASADMTFPYSQSSFVSTGSIAVTQPRSLDVAHSRAAFAVFHAGPSKTMHFYGTTGNGSVRQAGSAPRSSGDQMNGNAVMYDAGKILTLGGAVDYENAPATAAAVVIDLTGTGVAVQSVSPMISERAFHMSVVLPDGSVAVFGGQPYPQPFSDAQAVMTPGALGRAAAGHVARHRHALQAIHAVQVVSGRGWCSPGTR